MPYIKKHRREKLDHYIEDLAEQLTFLDNNKGDLNYTISRLVALHLKDVGKSYDSLSDITGVLNDVKTEFERRVVSPYENQKILENGDVYNTLENGDVYNTKVK